MELKDLTVENIGSWPVLIKSMVTALVCVMIFLLFYFFDVRTTQIHLRQAHAQEMDLRANYEVKYSQAVNLPAYQQQVKDMQKIVVNMVQKLPQNLDVPNLIEDISKMGLAAGLEFKSIKPLPEVEKDFYTEFPIDINVVGNYHQLAEFISNLANLKRIVTIDSFTITRITDNQNPADASVANAANSNVPRSNLLEMDIVAKTFKQSTHIVSKKDKGK